MGKLIKKFFDLANNKIGKIPTDKYAHFIGSLMIGFVLCVLYVNHTCMHWAVGSSLAVFTSLFMGVVVKEVIIDKIIRESYIDNGDIKADAYGTILGTVLFLLTLI